MSAAKQKLAVFDVDGTIFRSSLFVELVNLMVREGVFPKSMRKRYEEKYEEWQNREGGYSDYIEVMVEAFHDNIKGVHYADFRELSGKVVESQAKHTYRYTRELVKDLKSQDYYLLAVSHSPKTILDFFCPTLGFDKSYGVVFELGAADRFTGEIVDRHLIFNKANIVKRVVKKEGLTLNGSIAVGDTESDVSMLEMVEQPICFNPNSQLYKQARIRDWSVFVERKDVIYKVQ